MKKLFYFFVLSLSVAAFSSCEDDEGKLPEISLKSGSNYVSPGDSVTGGSTISIGITAKKTEKKDVLKKFNISKTIDGGNIISVFSKDLSGTEEDEYAYDFSEVLESNPGQVNKYTFTVTNRDGLTNQVSCKVVIK